MSDQETRPNLSMVRAAARESVFAEFGEDLRLHLTASEIEELVEDRMIRILSRENAERAAA